MSVDHPQVSRGRGDVAGRALALSGGLLLLGFVVNAIQRTLLHPLGAADDHEAIFAKYAASDVWVATHLAEFLLVLVALAGFLVLCRALWPETPYLALLGAVAIAAYCRDLGRPPSGGWRHAEAGSERLGRRVGFRGGDPLR